MGRGVGRDGLLALILLLVLILDEIILAPVVRVALLGRVQSAAGLLGGLLRGEDGLRKGGRRCGVGPVGSCQSLVVVPEIEIKAIVVGITVHFCYFGSAIWPSR